MRCGATRVLCPSWSDPRWRGRVEVIGEAFRLAAVGVGLAGLPPG
jgi:hypothetical protein